jgi:hypothetical protein
MGDLPTDDLRAIKALRQLLEREADAIDRHYMHAHLQALLYRSRDVFASALDEYDQACHQHDAEMDGIRAAFMAKWDQVPVLETYKQMAIRQQKAKTSSRRCGGRNAASPSMGPMVLGPTRLTTCRSGRRPTEPS